MVPDLYGKYKIPHTDQLLTKIVRFDRTGQMAPNEYHHWRGFDISIAIQSLGKRSRFHSGFDIVVPQSCFPGGGVIMNAVSP